MYVLDPQRSSWSLSAPMLRLYLPSLRCFSNHNPFKLGSDTLVERVRVPQVSVDFLVSWEMSCLCTLNLVLSQISSWLIASGLPWLPWLGAPCTHVFLLGTASNPVPMLESQTDLCSVRELT